MHRRRCPLLTSLVLYVGAGLLRPESDARRIALVDSLGSDPTEEERVALERQFLADPDEGGDPHAAAGGHGGDGPGGQDGSDDGTQKPTAAR